MVRVSAAVVFLLFASACTNGGATESTTTTSFEAVSESTTSVGLSDPATTTTSTTTTTRPLSELRMGLVEIDSGFNHPVLLVADPAGGHDFVVEQPGRIVRVDGDVHEVALDIRDEVGFQGEQGLLGLAFHPSFETNGLAYVNYTDIIGRTTIRQYSVRSGLFEPGSAVDVLVIDQPAVNHNGGMVAFGPAGYLWIGMGDGGGSNDTYGHGQDSHSLLGAMLRIAVPGTDGVPYAVPDSNPFANGAEGAPEVYWTGLRNPWRFSFDRGVGDTAVRVWVADVGQGRIEEVSSVNSDAAGANLGWPVMEGSTCFGASNCDPTPYVQPVTEYTHEEGCSITGGNVYGGSVMPELSGHFFYSDYCTGFLRSYSPETGDHDWTAMTGPITTPSGFGTGGDGELYVVSLSGTIHRLERIE